MKNFWAVGALALAIGNMPVTDAATLTTLHNFNFTNGATPVASLLLDAAGNLYGTTTGGGSSANCINGCGTVFELSPPTLEKPNWTTKILVNFRQSNGSSPGGALISDQAGNLYGTTMDGGKPACALDGCGSVFQLSPPAAGTTKWSQKTLLTFGANNGANPYAGLIMDQAGNLYGTALDGYNAYHDNGTVFQLSPPAAGMTNWLYSAIKRFNYRNGASPYAGLIKDQAGNLYGTTELGGTSANCFGGCGVVFRLAPPAPGMTKWSYQILVNFNGANGSSPFGNLILDQADNLYGTTSGGSNAAPCYFGCGTVFELSPPAPGTTKWSYKTLLNFDGTSGSRPLAGLVMDQTGNLYGTTFQGGSAPDVECNYGCGTVFELSPPAPGKTKWVHKVLVDFVRAKGAYPCTNLIIDQAGKLYGTTSEGGSGGYGTVFRVTP